ncbi:MAG: HAD family phosphatase [Lachnospiraceae bacterium]|nr:HAD family phosphatase [Lachnospiraceae bacterium]
MKDFDAVIFDMDGVIFDSERLVILCWKVVAEKYGIENIEEACRECLGLNREAAKEKMLLRYGADFPYDEYKKEMSDLFHSRYSGGRLPLKTGVVELLTYLKEQGIAVALASSTRSEVVLAELRDGGILPFFDKVICGDMVKRSKPAPDIYLKACEELQVEPERAYAIEDSYNGIRAAHSGGLRPIMVPDLAEPTEEMRELAEVILPDLVEVRKYLLNYGLT